MIQGVLNTNKTSPPIIASDIHNNVRRLSGRFAFFISFLSCFSFSVSRIVISSIGAGFGILENISCELLLSIGIIFFICSEKDIAVICIPFLRSVRETMPVSLFIVAIDTSISSFIVSFSSKTLS